MILSCRCADRSAERARRDSARFANALSYFDLAQLFDRYGFRIRCTAPIDDRQMLMRLTASQLGVAPVAACNVAVISESDAGSFGDRLGLHMINADAAGRRQMCIA